MTSVFLLSLAGCSTPTEIITKTVYVGVPDSLLVACPVPRWGGGTYRDLAKLTEARKKALKDCNDQLEQARDYQSKNIGEPIP